MKKILENPILKTICVLIVTYMAYRIGCIVGVYITSPLRSATNEGIQFGGKLYAPFIGIWIVLFAFVAIFKHNRYLFSMLGKGLKGNNVKTALLIGLPCGIGINLFVALVAMAHGDISLSYSSFNLPVLLYLLVVVFIQCGAEEILDRWFIYQKMREYFPKYPIVAILANALFFSSLHLMNPGVTFLSLVNILAIGILYSLIIYYFDSLWATMVAHTTWNFCQNIILGLPNSGFVSNYAIFSLDAASARDSFTYNVGFGIEGTILTDALIIVAIVIVIIVGKKKKSLDNN